MHDPYLLGELHGVNYSISITAECQRNLEYARTIPRMGFAISALPPSAAIVSAARQIDWAPSGNVSNSLSAAPIHETGRVFRVSAIG